MRLRIGTPPRMDRPDIRVQAAGPAGRGVGQRLPPPVLRGPGGHLQHQRPAQRDGHHRLHQQLRPDPQAGQRATPPGSLGLLKPPRTVQTNGAEYFSLHPAVFRSLTLWLCASQLFKKPHPPKRVRGKANGDVASVPPSSNGDKIFFHHLDNLRPSLAPVKGTDTRSR